jgi:structural protein gp24
MSASFQTVVQFLTGQGTQGDLYGDQPVRCLPYILNSASAANNIFGNAFTVVSQGVAEAGGAGVFAGFLVNPKNSALFGNGTYALSPAITLPNGSQAQLLTMGLFYAYLPAAAAIGDYVVYNTTTGALATIAPSGTVPGGFAFAQAFVDVLTVTAAGLAIINATPTLVTPA